MNLSVKLSEIIGEMEILTDESQAFLNKSTGQAFTLTDDDMREVDNEKPLEEYPEWRREIIKDAQKVMYENPDGYLALPSKFDMHEYRIMENFCHSVEDENISNALSRAIRGRGAFSKFKYNIHRFGIQGSWYKFRDEAFKEIAIEWCKDNDIKYVDDTKSSSDSES